MRLVLLSEPHSFCQLQDIPVVKTSHENGFIMMAVAPHEISYFCPTSIAPDHALKIEHDWRVFKVDAVMDFSLVGIMAKLSGTLAGAGVSILAMSTYDTDYLAVKEKDLDVARTALENAGYMIAA